MRLLPTLGALGLVTSLGACTTTGANLPDMADMLGQATGQDGRACVRKSSIQGYGVLEDNLISIDGLQNYYIATVLPGCFDLSTSMGVAFSSDIYEFCGQRMAKIVTADGHCTLGQMYEFESRDEAFAVYNALLDERRQMKASMEKGE